MRFKKYSAAKLWHLNFFFILFILIATFFILLPDLEQVLKDAFRAILKRLNEKGFSKFRNF